MLWVLLRAMLDIALNSKARAEDDPLNTAASFEECRMLSYLQEFCDGRLAILVFLARDRRCGWRASPQSNFRVVSALMLLASPTSISKRFYTLIPR